MVIATGIFIGIAVKPYQWYSHSVFSFTVLNSIAHQWNNSDFDKIHWKTNGKHWKPLFYHCYSRDFFCGVIKQSIFVINGEKRGRLIFEPRIHVHLQKITKTNHTHQNQQQQQLRDGKALHGEYQVSTTSVTLCYSL